MTLRLSIVNTIEHRQKESTGTGGGLSRGRMVLKKLVAL